LMYGKPIEEQIKRVIELYNKLKEIFRRLLKDEGIEI